MDLLEFMMELGIWCYLALKSMMPFTIGLDILQMKKVILHMFFLIIIQEPKLSNITLCLKKLIFNKNQNHCYYKIFLEKCFYQLPKNFGIN